MGRVLAAVVAALVWASAAQAFTKQDLRLTMDDGVPLAATLYLPDGAAPADGWPAVMVFHGLGQTRAPWNAVAEQFLVPQGYAVLTVDARGHGESGGQNDIAGPRTVQDVRALYEWLARQPVNRARVGAFGISLGGGTVWRAAADGVPFAALVPTTAWTDLYSALYPGHLAKSGAVLGFLTALPPERFTQQVNELRTDLLRSTNLAAVQALARERSTLHLLDRIRAPVFMLHGRRDFPFDLGQVRTAFRRLTVPKRLYIGNLGHAPATNPAEERPHYLTQVRLWFDRWLKGLPNGIDTRPPVEVAHDPWTGRTSSYRSFPPVRTMQLRFAGQRTIGADQKVVRTIRLPRRKHETFGTPVLRVSAATTTGWPQLVAVLSALTPGGQELVVSAGGAKTPTLGRRRRTVTLRLIDQATSIPAGSRLRLTLATSSTAQSAGNLLYLPFSLPDSLRLTVGRVRLALPVLRRPVSA